MPFLWLFINVMTQLLIVINPRPVADVSPYTIGYADEKVATYFFHRGGSMFSVK